MKCKNCKADNKSESICDAGIVCYVLRCGEYGCALNGKTVDKLLRMKKAATNADRIRSKSDEELAEFFGTLPCCPPGEDLEELCFPLDSCEGTEMRVKCWLKWLRQEAE